jgi:hypothetical protein
VGAACTDWQLERIRDDAIIVVNELVENARLHAGTPCRLMLRYNDLGLTIAVCDYRPDRVPRPPPVEPESERLSGLFVVAAPSGEWGVMPRADEKSVWAFLPVGDSAKYSRTIRRAAHDVVRAVLGYGVNSPVAASAVRRITAWLAVQHGASAVRDLADELALELGEAASAMAWTNEDEDHDGVGAWSTTVDAWFDDQQRPDLGEPATPTR